MRRKIDRARLDSATNYAIYGNSTYGNKFVNALDDYQNEVDNTTYTLNGAYAYKSTHSDLVDLFGVIGAIRNRQPEEVEELFAKAFREDKLLAMKMSFYARHITGGLGERKTPRIIWRYVAMNYPEIMKKNLSLIPVFGRWDDLYCFVGTPIEDDMWGFIRTQLGKDAEGVMNRKPISLLAKWLKSVNTSSEESRSLGRLTAKNLGMDEKSYRKILSMLRNYIDVTEVKMSKNNFSQIKYDSVPAKAMSLYRNAFMKRDGNRFQKYIDGLKRGEAKINAATLYPYDIMEKYGLTMRYRGISLDKYDEILEQQWKALPNFVDEKLSGSNVLVMCDTSGSMYGRPLATSVGLSIYFAERNKGVFHNKFMTFSHDPNFVTIKGDSLKDKVESFPVIVDDTNIQAAFKLILDVAVENNVPAEDMPKTLVIISDMEFNQATYNRGSFRNGEYVDVNYHNIFKDMYEEAGYEVPTIVYWNVNSRHNVFHAYADEHGVMMASGSSPSVFKNIVANIGKTPYEAMMDVLGDEVYSEVRV
ncbi:MAG: DUF2828 family protein [Methanobrevibacter sp.]|nr:DUF2828 family protein [Methanobrevibacter sp.]